MPQHLSSQIEISLRQQLTQATRTFLQDVVLTTSSLITIEQIKKYIMIKLQAQATDQ